MNSNGLHIPALLFWLIIISVPSISQNKVTCSCLPPNPPRDEFGVSRSAFSGRVQSIQAETLRVSLMLKVTFQVLHYWKGGPSSPVSLYTAMSTASCGFPFHVDSTYLVYALPYVDTLFTHLCTRTRPLSQAAEDLAFLTTVSVEQDSKQLALPTTLELLQNYRNPFNPSTTIRYELPKAANVSLKIFNTLGQVVATLVNERMDAGYNQVQWNASNVPSGIYFYRLQAGEFLETKKMIVLR